MRNLGSYIFDEFAKEQHAPHRHKNEGVFSKQVKLKNIQGTIVKLQNENYLNRPMGTYYTYEVADLNNKSKSLLERQLSKAISELLPKNYESILILGMGNEGITSDALGTKTLDHIDVLNIMDKSNKKLAKFKPSVFSVSGIESYDIIKGVISKSSPDVIIVVDSLCTRDIERIGKSFQITNAGIVPGSAVGSNVCNLSKETLGVNVISIGVPVVVYLHSVIQEIIENVKPLNQTDLGVLSQNLDKIDGIFSPKDIDFIIDFSSQIISQAIIGAII